MGAEPGLDAAGSTGSAPLGLALGGGGARGFAHIPILETLDELGVKPAIIAGTSIGAVLGGAYAAGLSGSELRERAVGLLTNPAEIARSLFSGSPRDWMELWSLRPLSASLMNAEKLIEIIYPEAARLKLEELTIPFRAIATDYREQVEVTLDSGPLGKAMAASMALPSLFRAIEYRGHALADGGLVNPLPYDRLAPEATFAVAIDVTGRTRLASDRPPSALEAMLASSQIMQNAIIREKLKRVRPDVLIRPQVDTFRVLEFYKIAEVLAAAEPAREDLKRAIDAYFNGARERMP